MPMYQYSAFDANGAEIRGTSQARDKDEVKKLLKTRGLVLVELELSPESPALFGGRALSALALTRLTRQIAVLLRGGVPIAKAIRGIADQEAWADSKSMFIGLVEDVEKGKSLHEALESRSEHFPLWYVAAIRVGEATGRISEVMFDVASHLERDNSRRHRLQTALTYPIIMLFACAGIVIFLIAYLIPTLSFVFLDFRQTLPLPTRILIFVGNLGREYWVWLMSSFLILISSVSFLRKKEWFKRQAENNFLRIPFLGVLFKDIQLEIWIRQTSMMLKCGMSILEATRLSQQTSSSFSLVQALTIVEERISRGVPFFEALTSAKFFPGLLVQMSEAGEAAGDLPRMLDSVASEIGLDVERKLDTGVALIEPAMIVFLGVLVGAIMVSVLLPIYSLKKL